MRLTIAAVAATLVLPFGAAYASPPDKGNNGNNGNNNRNNNSQNQSQNQSQRQQQSQQQTACAEANVVKIGDITITIAGEEPLVVEHDDEPCGGD